MALYKILMVDDEEEIRQAMVRKIDWNALGFEMAGTASNGQEALELAEQLKVDVVMTDIKMPFMDGLTLCKKLKENYRNMKVVIYSGFDEFEYAREAIRLEAEEYLLKPISSKDMQEVFSKIRENLDKEFNERRNLKKLNEYYYQSLPAMQEQFIMGILEGKLSDEKTRSLMTYYQLDLEASHYVVSMIHVAGNHHDSKDMENFLLPLSLRDIARDYLQNNECNFYSTLYLNETVMIFMLERMEELEEVMYHLGQICKVAERTLERTVTASVGKVCDSLGEVSNSYQQAVNAMEYRKIVEGSVIYIGDVEPSIEETIRLPEYDMQKLFRAVKLGSQEETRLAIDAFLEHFQKNAITPQQYQLACMEIVTEFIKIGRTFELGMDDVFGSEADPWEEIQHLPSLEELKEWMLHIATNLRNVLKRARSATTKSLTEQAKEYIANHYRESDLSAETICHELNVSAAYFSTIFKKQEGMSFVAYLTKLRMERAAQLLRTTEEKTYVIAEQVGYVEANYFSYVFKKEYGVSPTKYRADLMKEGK